MASTGGSVAPWAPANPPSTGLDRRWLAATAFLALAVSLLLSNIGSQPQSFAFQAADAPAAPATLTRASLQLAFDEPVRPVVTPSRAFDRVTESTGIAMSFEAPAGALPALDTASRPDPAKPAETPAPPPAATAPRVEAAPSAPAAAPPPAAIASSTPQAATSTASAEVVTAAPVAPSAPLNARAGGLFLAMNAERSAHGLAPLKIASDLNQIAQSRSDDMTANGYFSHVSPTGSSWLTLLTSSGIHLSGGGENLARVSGDAQRSVAVAISALMDSPTHRENILNAGFTEVGVAAVTDADGVTIFTTIFATR